MVTKKKKTTTKKAPVKKAAKPRKKVTTSRKSTAKLVGLQPETTNFMTFRVTMQTIYWFALGAIVIVFTLWLTQLQMNIQGLYDEIDAANMSALSAPTATKR